jgi:hypothetical protein
MNNKIKGLKKSGGCRQGDNSFEKEQDQQKKCFILFQIQA